MIARLLGFDMIETVHHVRLVPYSKAWTGGPDASLIPPHGRIAVRTDENFQDQFPPLDPLAAFARLEGHYLYGGPLKNHFGHFMVDSIIRLWAFDKSKHQGVVFCNLDAPQPLSGWMLDVLEVFGIAERDVHVIRANTTVDRLDFAIPSSRLAVGPHPWYLDLMDAKAARLNHASHKRIYFGRSHLIRRGTLMGGSYFDKTLDKANFVSVIPEKFSIQQQLDFIRNAEEVVFAEGSSIYSIELLGRIRANIYMIPRRGGTRHLFEPHIAPRTAFHMLGEPTHTLRKPNRGGKSRPSSPSYTIAPEKIHADMVRFGLVDGRFDLVDFEAHEASDAAIYFEGMPAIAEAQLRDLRKRRLQISARASLA